MTPSTRPSAPARLAIADPPYPPSQGIRGVKSRARRWYGGGIAYGDPSADFHAAAAEWDDPARHRQLLEQLEADFDGWAIATAPDGIDACGTLPAGARRMAWFRPNAMPSASRIRSCWELVLLKPPRWRLSGRDAAGGCVPDVLIEPSPRDRLFAGQKPARWTWWVLDALGFEPEHDTVTDLFPGSGAVASAAASWCEPMVPA